jgi:hypothetical protein
MPKRKKKCPKCHGEMEKGYLLGAWSWISDKNQCNPREAKKNLWICLQELQLCRILSQGLVNTLQFERIITKKVRVRQRYE